MSKREVKHCRCGDIRGEVRRGDGWLYCGNCSGRIGDMAGDLPRNATTASGADDPVVPSPACFIADDIEC